MNTDEKKTFVGSEEKKRRRGGGGTADERRWTPMRRDGEDIGEEAPAQMRMDGLR